MINVPKVGQEPMVVAGFPPEQLMNFIEKLTDRLGGALIHCEVAHTRDDCPCLTHNRGQSYCVCNTVDLRINQE